MRLHDKIYLKSNRYNKPKERDKLLLKIIKLRNRKSKKLKILDIGCANGELIYFLNRNLKNVEIHGYEIRKDLIVRAKQYCKKSKFKRVDITKRLKFKEKFDIIICSGVISIFDDLNIFFKNIKRLSKKNSSIYLSGNFSEYNYNVKIKYDDLKLKTRIDQSGWNIWSINHIKKYFKNKKFSIFKLKMPFDVKQKKSDLIRSWTIKIKNKRFFTNALNIIQNHMWLEFR